MTQNKNDEALVEKCKKAFLMEFHRNDYGVTEEEAEANPVNPTSIVNAILAAIQPKPQPDNSGLVAEIESALTKIMSTPYKDITSLATAAFTVLQADREKLTLELQECKKDYQNALNSLNDQLYVEKALFTANNSSYALQAELKVKINEITSKLHRINSALTTTTTEE